MCPLRPTPDRPSERRRPPALLARALVPTWLALVAVLGACTTAQAPASAPTASGDAPSASPAPAAATAGGDPGRAETPQRSGKYAYHTVAASASQDPIQATGASYLGTWGRALSSLLRFDVAPDIDSGTYILAPDLAVAWDNPEPNIYIVRLRHGVAWQDVAPVGGREFVADDVVFNVERLAGEGSAHAWSWRDLERVEALDSHTLRFTLTRPSADFLALLARESSKMVAPEAVAAGGGHLERGPTIGTGAWLVECDDIECTFDRNPTHHLTDADGIQIPYLDTMSNIIMPDVHARFGLFRAGLMDSHDLTTEQRFWLRYLHPEVEVDEFRLYESTVLHFRTDQAPWNDERVRTAVSRAIDVRAVNDAVHGGRGHFGLGMAMPSSSAYLPESEILDASGRDVEEARRLLGDAGYAGGIDARLWVARYSESDVTTAELLREQMAEAGIRATLFVHDPATYLSQVLRRHGDFQDMALGPQGSQTAGEWLASYYHSAGGLNASSVNDPDLDRMIEAQAADPDPQRRARALQDIQRYLQERSYALVIHSPVGQTASWPWVRNRAYSAGADHRAHEYVWIDPDLRP